jgi:hypothetical protein
MTRFIVSKGLWLGLALQDRGSRRETPATTPVVSSCALTGWVARVANRLSAIHCRSAIRYDGQGGNSPAGGPERTAELPVSWYSNALPVAGSSGTGTSVI